MAKLKTMTVKMMVDGAEKEVTLAVIGPNGHPVYEIDGKDVEQDPVELRNIITASNDENAKHRIKNKELQDKVDAIGDLDVEKAREALGIVANLDAKKLVDAKDMDALKEQLGAAWQAKLESATAAYEAKLAEANSQIDAEKVRLKNMMVKNAFLGSEFLRQTIYDPVRDDAYKIFGENFGVEQVGENGDIRVSYIRTNPDGSQVLSTARPGQPLTFDEAIEHIITNHPQKDHLMKGSQASGSGAHGGAGGGSKSTLQQLKGRQAAAIKEGNTLLSMQLKDQINTMERAGTTASS